MRRHGAEFHLVRPDLVYGTGVLMAIPGFNPVVNAQDVAARFTALWQPNVADAPAMRAAGPSARAIAPMPTPAAPNAGVSGFGARMTLVDRFRVWRAQRKLKKALHGYSNRQIEGLGTHVNHQIHLMGLGAVRDPVGEKYGTIPVVGGYAPAFQTQADVGLAIATKALSIHSMPPVLLPASAAAAGISPFALAPEALSTALVQYQQNASFNGLGSTAVPPIVAYRAHAAAMQNVYERGPGWPWWGR